MDLQSVESKLNKGSYDTVLEFYHDVELIWLNSMTYNRDGSEYFVVAEKMSKIWEMEFSKKFKRDKHSNF